MSFAAPHRKTHTHSHSLYDPLVHQLLLCAQKTSKTSSSSLASSSMASWSSPTTNDNYTIRNALWNLGSTGEIPRRTQSKHTQPLSILFIQWKEEEKRDDSQRVGIGTQWACLYYRSFLVRRRRPWKISFPLCRVSRFAVLMSVVVLFPFPIAKALLTGCGWKACGDYDSIKSNSMATNIKSSKEGKKKGQGEKTKKKVAECAPRVQRDHEESSSSLAIQYNK